MTRPLPSIIVHYLERVEGERTHAYRDVRGIWTCGVGCTEGVTADTVWTQAEIDQHLAKALATAAQRLENAVGARVVANLNENQYAAMLSFVFNAGAKPEWTIWGCVKTQDWPCVARQMSRFIYVEGKVNDGLTKRRTADVALWNGEDPLCQS